MLAMMMNPHLPPGRSVSQRVTRSWPPRASKTKAKKFDASSIIITRPQMLAVARPASPMTFHVKRPFSSASRAATTAPTEPTSLGVAIPWKIAPSTQKIRAIGGTMAMSDSRTSAQPRYNWRSSSGNAGAFSG